MKPFDRAPINLRPVNMWPLQDGSELNKLCNGLLEQYRTVIRSKIADDQFDIRFLRAITYLIPYLQNSVETKNLNALEIGSGHGAKAIALSHIFKNYTGLEIQQSLIEFADRARAHFEVDNVTFTSGNAGDIKSYLADHQGSFNFIILYAVLEHLTIEEKLEVLSVCWEYLDDDGFLFIGETPNRMLPLDLHSTKMFYFQQMPIDLMERCVEDTLNDSWSKDLSIAVSSGRGRETLYRRGIHLGHQEFEKTLMSIEKLRRHLVTDNFSPAILNQYVYLDIEFLKAIELSLIRGYRGRDDVQDINFPSMFGRYFIEGIFRKGPFPDALSDTIVINPAARSSKLSSELFPVGIAISRWSHWRLEAPAKECRYEVSIEIGDPFNAGLIVVLLCGKRKLVELRPKELAAGLSKHRGRLVVSLGKISSEDFPITFRGNSWNSSTLNFVFLRPERH
jgi:2-polyprenyl-3-methyl-5-hydroxy-6-metoxy-1,4-benzoquinol methylase